ncbi:MAG TPA: hypothetical protein VK694_01775 [Verrucomicrobiae bacterium]|nr:hypothetical protein [Verrucomicrobiae bacterium]
MIEGPHPNPTDLGPAEGAEDLLDKPVPIPTYDTVEQFTVEDLNRQYPDWQQETSYADPELAAIGFARVDTLRQVGEELGLGHLPVHAGGEGLGWALTHTPSEVGTHYDAHGIANKYDPVVALDRLLTGGIDPDKPMLYSMGFIDDPENGSAVGADRPLTSGGFIVVAEKDKKLAADGISYVVTGEEYASTLDILRERHPEVTFLSWDEAPAVFTQQTNEAGDTDISVESLYQDEHPTYERPQNNPVLAGDPGEAPMPFAKPSDDDPDVW